MTDWSVMYRLGVQVSSDNAPVSRAVTPYRKPSEHYENFPVASWLCPAALRPAIAAIYWFARSADDIADEGDADEATRLGDLAQFRDDLLKIDQGQVHSGRWPGVFDALEPVLRQFRLPLPLLCDLLDAFEQDVVFTAQKKRYDTDQQLLDYCRRSANPVGRLLLHLYRVTDADSVRRSDLICTALQLINFWQDLRADIARARWYPSRQAMAQHGVQDSDLLGGADNARARAKVAAYALAAEHMMREGAPLARRIPGRAGWELRLVVQGGLRILEKMAQMNHATWLTRPRLHRHDGLILVWRAWRGADSGVAGATP